MARLLIVSRSMALAMRLADQHEVNEHPADELDSLIQDLDTDVLVLDVGDAVLAVNTVNALREAEKATPVLLVSGYQPEWEQVEAQRVEGVHVVPLPITRMALLEGVAALLGEEVTLEPTLSGSTGQVPELADDGAYNEGTESDQEEYADEYAADGYEHEDDAYETDDAGYDQAEAGYEDAEYPAEDVDGPEGEEARGEEEVDEPAAAQRPPADPTVPIQTARPGSRPAPPRIPAEGGPAQPEPDAPPTVVESEEVAGLAYSNGITRPFAEEPRSGPIPIIEPEAPRTPGRWLRTSSPAPDPEGPPTPGSGGRRLSRLGSRPRKLQRHPNNGNAVAPSTGGMGLVTDPLGPRTDPYGFPMSALDRRLDAEAAALVTARSSTGDGGIALRTGELIRLLHERVGELYGVSDTAQVLADDVVEKADADSAAILVPDGPVWRVSGGVGLRPLERRLVLEDSHWLITEIGSAGRAVLIEDTDIIRQQLAGAPLAAWRHLLAVPVPDVRAIVVLARGQEGGPFTDRDLSAVIAPVREAAPLLAQAIETRRLARLLSTLREQDGDGQALRRPDY